MKELPVYASHGTNNAYSNYGCRCEPCREAASAYKSQRRTLHRESYNTYMREYMRVWRAKKQAQA